jgi:hypothetical protein
LNLAAADALGANPLPADFSVFVDDLDGLQVRVKRATAGAGDFLADATEVLGLTAIRLLIALSRLFTARGALHAHVRELPDILESIYYSGTMAGDKFSLLRLGAMK